jgi:Holliday junction DNA helicase RuvA
MIASVRGEVLVRRPDHVVVESGGVGYRLTVSAETLKAVPASGKEATLHAHLVIRDDSMQLYGFASEEERDLFLHLTSVSGIGPKVAVAILSGGTPRELLRAIAAGDAKRFQAVNGVGKRTSERLIVELREKVAGELEEGVPALAGVEGDSPRSLARDGLMHLGYTFAEAEELLAGASGETPEALIGSALRAASKGAA